ncbi:DUF4494 domain-containing protein [bacterium]|nr:DUF4494 domain-containing protein [bacterium]
MFYEVQVEVEFESDSGRIKKVKEYYLVKAVSVTDAEAKIYKEFEGEQNDWDVKMVKESKIRKVVDNGEEQ